MNMKKFLKLLLFIILFSNIFAQNLLENPLEIKSEGEKPEILTKFLQNNEDNFLKYLYFNGKLVYGSKINKYLEKIADNVLKDYPELRKEITILVGKSPTTNAYANINGLILINTGLIAQVSNEAEIAFIISHEIVHYYLKHKYLYVEYKNDIDNFLNHHLASREQESEADKKGIELFFSQSDYSYNAIDGAFDVLQYGYLPFDNVPFEKTFVENEYFQFPDKYFLGNVNPINNRDDYNDTLCTHPNIAKRRMAAKNMIDTKDNSGRKNFIQAESLFTEIQTAARLDCINQWIIFHKFADAYYNSYVLLKKEKYQEYELFLKNAMAVSVYGMSKHKYAGSIRDILGKISEIEGEQQKTFNFFNELTKQEFSVLALRLLWETKNNNVKENPIVDKLCADIISSLINNDKLKLNNFCDYPMGTVADSIIDDVPEIIDNSQSKYEKIKQQNIVKVKPASNFKTVNYMLSDIKQNRNFIIFFQDIQNTLEDEKINELISKQKMKYNGEKVVFLNPKYIYTTKKQKIENSNYQKRMEKSLISSAKSLKIDYSFIDNKNINNYNTTQYNDYSKLYEWLIYVYNVKNRIEPYFVLNINNISPDCKYLIIATTYSKKEKLVFSFSRLWEIIVSIPFYPTLPLHVSKTFLRQNTIQTYFSLINITNGNVEFSDDIYHSRAISSEALNHAFLYDCLYKLKKGNKNEK